jgi:hypothetical protein
VEARRERKQRMAKGQKRVVFDLTLSSDYEDEARPQESTRSVETYGKKRAKTEVQHLAKETSHEDEKTERKPPKHAKTDNIRLLTPLAESNVQTVWDEFPYWIEERVHADLWRNDYDQENQNSDFVVRHAVVMEVWRLARESKIPLYDILNSLQTKMWRLPEPTIKNLALKLIQEKKDSMERDSYDRYD